MTWLLLAAFAAAAAPAQKTQDLCVACHQTQVEDFQSHPHQAKGLGCEVCHGASKEHRESTGNRPPERIAGPAEVPALCGACHTSQRKEYESSRHGALVLARSDTKAANCTTCHGVHAPRSPAATEAQCRRCHETLPESCRKPVRVAAKVSCAGCHQPHTLGQRSQPR